MVGQRLTDVRLLSRVKHAFSVSELRSKLPEAANSAQETLGQDQDEVTLLENAGAHALPRIGK